MSSYFVRSVPHKNKLSILRNYLLFTLIVSAFSVTEIAAQNQTQSQEVDSDYSQHVDLNPASESELISGLENVISRLSSISDEEPEPEDENEINQILESRSKCNFPGGEGSRDYYLSTLELLEREGYAAETHYVSSQDGYITEVHRIPAPGKPVVFALHGVFQSSRDFLMNCEGRALGHKLFNAGYDVWLGNIRGNSYGRNHSTLSPKNREFWNWGIDEVSLYDSPATVDYILKVTGQAKLNYIGYSVGSTVLYAMLSGRPEYNEKINLGITMSNSVFMSHTRISVFKLVSAKPFRRLIELYFNKFWRGEALSKRMAKNVIRFGPGWCKFITRSVPFACPATLWPVDGRDPKQLNIDYLPLTQGGIPDSTSGRFLGHYLQNVADGVLTKYDYGSRKNLAMYGSRSPPIYNLSNIAAPLINYYGDNDPIATKTDLSLLQKNTPTLLGNIRVNWTAWNHYDYVYAKDADVLLYDHVLKTLKKWNPLV